MEGTPEPLPGWEVLAGDVSFRGSGICYLYYIQNISSLPLSPAHLSSPRALLFSSFPVLEWRRLNPHGGVLPIARRHCGLLPLALSCLLEEGEKCKKKGGSLTCCIWG